MLNNPLDCWVGVMLEERFLSESERSDKICLLVT